MRLRLTGLAVSVLLFSEKGRDVGSPLVRVLDLATGCAASGAVGLGYPV